jgi:hypothetical protein
MFIVFGTVIFLLSVPAYSLDVSYFLPTSVSPYTTALSSSCVFSLNLIAIHHMHYSTSALMYVCATCPHSVKAELILIHSWICNHIYVDIERENATAVVFQQDDTSPHFSLQFHLALNNRFPDWWIGGVGSIAWPQRCLDVVQ